MGVRQSDVEGRAVAHLQIRQVREQDLRIYTLVAENSVSVAAKDVPLVCSQSTLSQCHAGAAKCIHRVTVT